MSEPTFALGPDSPFLSLEESKILRALDQYGGSHIPTVEKLVGVPSGTGRRAIYQVNTFMKDGKTYEEVCPWYEDSTWRDAMGHRPIGASGE